MRVRWSDRARDDFYEAIAYIAVDSPDNAALVQERIEQAIGLLAAQPGMGRAGRVDGTRELVVDGTSYIIPYRVQGREIQLAAMIHARQRWPDDVDWTPLNRT